MRSSLNRWVIALTLLLVPTLAQGEFFDSKGRLIESITSTATAAATTTLDYTSNRNQRFTGTTTQNLALPSATTLRNGTAYVVENDSTGAITVKNTGASTLGTVPAGNTWTFLLADNGSANGTWTIRRSLDSGLTSAHVLVGSASGIATDVAVSGDLTMANTGAATVATVGGSTASNVHAAELLANAATAANTASAILKRDGSGQVAATTFTGALVGNADTATTATNATNGTTTSVSNSASYFPLFSVSSSNGNHPFNLGTGLTFNPSTNNLTTTTFTGALSGNATTATSATTATNATNATTVSTTTNASFFPLFVASSSNGNQAHNLGTGLTFNPSTNVLTTTTFVGALTGTASGNLTYTPTNHGVVVSGSGNAASVTSAGTAGQVMTSNGASADPTYQDVSTLAGVPTQPYEADNLGVSASISSNTLIVSLKQSDGSTDPAAAPANVKASFRGTTATNGNYSSVSFTAANSITLAATDSIGEPASGTLPLNVYLISDTTSEICLSRSLFDQRELQSASALTGGADTSATTLWCSSAHTSKPVRLIGKVQATWSNPNWGSITLVSIDANSAVPGDVVTQTVTTSFDTTGVGAETFVDSTETITLPIGRWILTAMTNVCNIANASWVLGHTFGNIRLTDSSNNVITTAVLASYIAAGKTGCTPATLMGYVDIASATTYKLRISGNQAGNSASGAYVSSALDGSTLTGTNGKVSNKFIAVRQR